MLAVLFLFSEDEEVAKDFVEREFENYEWEEKKVKWFYDGAAESAVWKVILNVPKLTKGADVDEFSQFEGAEAEIIVSGKFKIVDMGLGGEGWMGMSSFKEIRQKLLDKGYEYKSKKIPINQAATVHVVLEEIQ